jgi:hypothetical protein
MFFKNCPTKKMIREYKEKMPVCSLEMEQDILNPRSKLSGKWR